MSKKAQIKYPRGTWAKAVTVAYSLYLSGVVCLVVAGAVNHIYIDNIWFYVLKIITCIISAVAGIYCTVKESQKDIEGTLQFDIGLFLILILFLVGSTAFWVFDYFDGNKRNAASIAMVVGASCMVNIHDKKK